MSSTLYTGSNYGVISSGNSYNTTSFAAKDDVLYELPEDITP